MQSENAKPETTEAQNKRQASLSFDGGTLTIRLSGYGEENGSGWFTFDEDDVEWQPHDERSGSYLVAKAARSEMIALRDWLDEQAEGCMERAGMKVSDGKSPTTAELPTSVPWSASEDRPYYIAKLWLEAGQRRREAARLTGIIAATLEEADRIEALARKLEDEQ